jgi:hypothetical protein
MRIKDDMVVEGIIVFRNVTLAMVGGVLEASRHLLAVLIEERR